MIEATIPPTEFQQAKPERVGTVGATAEKAMGMEDFLWPDHGNQGKSFKPLVFLHFGP